ncbi:major facilitator superfamily domain-containing protein [Dactylonectria estremocensis]|uniref:Major facilitator superfamily domain-containing protein n=1 Tax=Dactylonectria estremocensis TaxID=1079267 RepID=A0A9P9F6V4_9HYPO|nr:major facilitator superfamily domain-containing protein [Dactylonectria estremocensis]
MADDRDKDPSVQEIDTADSKWERRHVEERKVDIRLIPILGILYSIAGLDRVNLSNARVAGMNEDLHFDVGGRYSIALLVFFITYFLFELPTTLSLRRVGPKLLLNGLVLSWGIVMLGMGWAKDWRVIVVCRMLIGVFEAGFLPCWMYLLSSWYQQYEVQKRMALWYIINLFVSAFGNILAYALIKLDGTHNIAGWRCIFIIEGAITIGFAFISFAFTLPFPDQLLASVDKSSFTLEELEAILDRELWAYGFMFLCCSAPIYAFAYFIQIILTTLGYSTAVVFLLCAPPYLFSIFWTLGVAWLADRSRVRMPWMVLNAAIALTELLLTAYHKSVFLGVAGSNANLPTIIAFQSNNVRGASRRSVASGVEYPTYRTGVWCGVATQFFLIVLVALMYWWFRRQNGKADQDMVAIQGDVDYRYTF